jgi:hypothetical protein
MKLKKTNYYIGIISIIMIAVISPVFIYESNENYGYTLYYILIVVACWLIFWAVFLLIGLILKKSLMRNELTWNGLKKTFEVSFIITFFILVFGFIVFLIKDSN